MAKRPLEDVDDSEEDGEETSPRKRVRTDGDVHQKRGQQGVTPSQAGRDEDGDEAPTRVEQRWNREELVLTQLHEADAFNRPKQGEIAEHGIIQTLYMENFMCHQRLRFDFGPQINFIIGHNGSGKSAVLTALTVALGGKAAATKRGNSLNSLIKEGEGYSEVSVTLKNKGPDAYRPDVYGDSITVTRRFTKDGKTGYKIRGALAGGKVISTKREELTAICDYMNIQVDNPMTVLTQDTARQFLSTSKPMDRYALFLRGTQLLQLSAEFDTIKENLKRTDNVLQHKKRIIPDLQEEWTNAEERWEGATEARNQRARLKALEREKAWSLTDGKAMEVAKQEEQVKEGERVLPELRAQLAEAEIRQAAATEALTRSEAAIGQGAAASQPVQEEKGELNAEIREKKSTIMKLTNEENQMNVQLKTLNATIKMVEDQIKDEIGKLAADSREKHEHHQALLAAGKAEVDEREKAVADNLREQEQYRTEAANAREEVARAQRERDGFRNQVSDLQSQISHVQTQKNGAMAGFGSNIPQLLDLIKQERWLGDTPVGPLGMFVELKDTCKQFGQVLRVVLGKAMKNFAITDSRDRAKLKALLHHTKNDETQILISQRDIFDFAHAEPPAGVLTMLRALEIKDEFVLRLLVNGQSIERSLLSVSRAEAEQTMKNYGLYGNAYCCDGLRFRRYDEGGSSTSPLGNALSGNDVRHFLFRKSPEETVHNLQAELQDAEHRYRGLEKDVARLRSDAGRFESEHTRLQRSSLILQAAVRRSQSALEKIQQELQEEEPASLDALQHELREAQDEKETLLDLFSDASEKKATVQADLDSLAVQVESLNRRIVSLKKQDEEYRRSVVKAAEEQLRALQVKHHYEKKLQVESAGVEANQAALNTLISQLTDWIEQVQDNCGERPDPVRKTEDIDRLIDGIRRVLKGSKAGEDSEYEAIEADMKRVKSVLVRVEEEYNGLLKLRKTLKDALKGREEKWGEFRSHIAARAMHQFQFYMARRGYFAKLKFNHELSTLEVKVHTENNVAGTSQTAQEKDPRALSGGEKSFSTICMLLSLWDAMSCPIRCLDEFDVFMDAQNRRFAMDLMTTAGKEAAGTQYILITPQDMSNVSLGPEVCVHRMSDPERGPSSV